MNPAPDFGSATESYLAHLSVERGLAAATIAAYRGDLADYAAHLRQAPDAWDRSPQVPLEYLAARTRRGRPGEVPLAAASLRRRAASIRGFYRFAFGEGLIDVDVANQLDLPRQSRLLPDPLAPDDVERLLESVAPDGGAGRPDPRTIRDRALLELLYAAGLRVSEALGLDRPAVSFDAATVRVVGKGRKERCTPIAKSTLAVLKTWLREPQRGVSDVLFPSAKGERLSVHGVQYMLNKHRRTASKVCVSLKQKRVTVHRLRHTAAMELLQAGVDRAVIALWLGHESVETTQI